MWASVREPYNYIQAKQLGCHIITIPPSTIEKLKILENLQKVNFRNRQGFLIDSKNLNLEFKLL